LGRRLAPQEIANFTAITGGCGTVFRRYAAWEMLISWLPLKRDPLWFAGGAMNFHWVDFWLR